MYERLAYVSVAAPGIAARDCYDIIRVAHNRNSQQQLTGGLLFLDGHFVQVLEGHPRRLRQRYDIIAADVRHHDVQLCQTVVTDRLLFADDWMALRSDAEIPLDLRARWDFGPGWWTHRPDAGHIVEFVRACCQRQVQAVGA